eukprot:ANDGO_03723.mRNA.1 hypothetical protein
MQATPDTIAEPFLSAVAPQKPKSAKRATVLSLSALSAALGILSIAFIVAYVKLQKDCHENCSSTSSSNSNTNQNAALPNQFSAYGVQVTRLNGAVDTVDWHHDGAQQMDTVTWSFVNAATGASKTADIVRSYSTLMMEINEGSAFCQGFPLTSTIQHSFMYTSKQEAGTQTDASGAVCLRFQAVRADGSIFYFAFNVQTGALCAVEIDNKIYRFAGPLQPLDASKTKFLCTGSSSSSSSSFDSAVHMQSIFGDIKCGLCKKALDWAIDKLVGYGSDAACSELGAFAEACGFIAEEAVKGVCDHFDCAEHGCDLIHMC